jgi:hypothetical protein
MAWLTLGAALGTPVWVMMSATFASVAPAYLAFCGTVVAVYIGGSVVDDKWQKEGAG